MPARPDRPRALSRLPAKLAVFVLLAIAARTAVVGWVSIDWTWGFFRGIVEQSFPGNLEGSATRLEAWLAAGRSQVESLAADPRLARDLARGGLPRAGTLLDATLARSPMLDGLWLAAADGTVRVARGERPPPAHLAAALLDPGLHVLGADAPPPVPVACAPLPARGGRPAGWLVGTFRPSGVARQLTGDSLPGVGRGYVVDADGTVLFAGTRGDPLVGTRLPLERLQHPAPGPAGSADWEAADGTPRIGIARPLAVLGWNVAVAASLDAGFVPVKPLLWRIVLLDAALILVVTLLVYQLAGSLLRPVDALCEAARRIAEGDLHVEVPESPADHEIGDLTRTFNAMAQRLQDDQTEISAVHQTLREQNQALQAANEVLAQLSITDGLTKLHNHRFFQDHLTRELKRVKRTGEPLCMLLIDIDDFKGLNDRHGHAAGDAVLARIGQVMNATVRESDLLARYGGEEFVVLAGTDLEGAVRLAEKLRMAVMETQVPVEEGAEPGFVTVSIGVSRYKGDRKVFFRDADRALYGAKEAGKNCVVVDAELY